MAGVWDPSCMKLMPKGVGCLDSFRAKACDDVLRATLFVYQHMKSGKYMLARWLMEHHVFLPILELGDEPLVSEDAMTRFRQYCYPQARESMTVAVQQAADNQRKLDEELEHDRRESRAKILRDENGIAVPDTDGRVFLPPGVLGG